jgi:uncharacterized protein YkwD
MRSHTRPPVRAAIVTLLIILSTLLGSSFVMESASASLRGKMLHSINRKRAAHDVHRLRLNRRLSRKATHHTRTMIRRNRLYHTRNLERVVRRYNSRSWGENVGCARNQSRLMRKFIRSAAHRSNLLARSYRRVGLGVVSAKRRNRCGRGSVWATQIFYG